MQRRLLVLNMDSVWADEVLRERGGSLDNRAIYYMTLMATGSKEQAEDAKSKRIMEELRQGRTPEV